MSVNQTGPYYLRVSIGEAAPAPVPMDLAQALVTAKINRSDTVPSGFELVFIDQPSLTANDYPLMSNPLLAEFNRVLLEVVVSGLPTILIDGYITEKELHPDDHRIVIRGEDLSVKMDLFQISKPYPQKTPSAIAAEVLRRYAGLGITAAVTAPENEVTPTTHTPHQLETDRTFLQKLARNSDRRFYMKFNPSATAYWGPPERNGPAQPTLTSNTVMFGNVEKLEPQYQSLSAELNYGSKLADGDSDKESAPTPFGAQGFLDVALADVPAPLQTFVSLDSDPEAFEQQISTLKVRGKYMRHQQLNPGSAPATAQSRTDMATSQVATVKGELDTARYGHVLETPGTVGVRGIGQRFDGLYYVQEVTHDFTLQRGATSYKQTFTLTREGTNSKTQQLGA